MKERELGVPKSRNEGLAIELHHGSPESFDEFDPNKARLGGYFRDRIHFSIDAAEARRFGPHLKSITVQLQPDEILDISVPLKPELVRTFFPGTGVDAETYSYYKDLLTNPNTSNERRTSVVSSLAIKNPETFNEYVAIKSQTDGPIEYALRADVAKSFFNKN